MSSQIFIRWCLVDAGPFDLYVEWAAFLTRIEVPKIMVSVLPFFKFKDRLLSLASFELQEYPHLVMWLYFFCLFLFDLVYPRAGCGCFSIVYLRFVMQIKQVDCKMGTKKKISFKKYFVIFLDTCTHKNIKPRKKLTVRFQLNLYPIVSLRYKRITEKGIFNF